MLNTKHLDSMKHSPLFNYAGIPGLTSWLITQPGPQGVIRMFENERDHHEVLTPHSHRYDFECLVLEGHVVNKVWNKSEHPDAAIHNDCYVATSMEYVAAHTYKRKKAEAGFYFDVSTIYEKGESYSMTAHEIHSIQFSRGAKVLFFEGPQVSNESVILEPVANGHHVRTFKVEPWMFSATRMSQY